MRTFLLLAALAACLVVTAPARAQSNNPSFNLVNRGADAIVELYVTPAGDARWGQNRLAGRSIAPGARFAVRRRIDGNCIFDVRVVFADHRILDRRDLDTCTVDDVAVGAAAAPIATAAAKPPGDPSFQLVNNAPQSMLELFATPAGDGRWGQNRLATPLPPHSQRLIRVTPQPNTCLYDLRVVFADRHARERHRTDLCRTTRLPVQ